MPARSACRSSPRRFRSSARRSLQLLHDLCVIVPIDSQLSGQDALDRRRREVFLAIRAVGMVAWLGIVLVPDSELVIHVEAVDFLIRDPAMAAQHRLDELV